MMAGGIRVSLSGCNSVVATADGVVHLAMSFSAYSNFQGYKNIEIATELFKVFFSSCFCFLRIGVCIDGC